MCVAGGIDMNEMSARDLYKTDVPTPNVSNPIAGFQRIEIVRLDKRDETLLSSGAIFHQSQRHTYRMEAVTPMSGQREALVHVPVFGAEMKFEFVIKQRRLYRIPAVTGEFVSMHNRVTLVAFIECVD